ncbi:hypothetical protein R1T43_01380 [Alteromonas sp. CI.11.F.A3]|uniref:hypothetical protein n=1 Tax=Alteromonas sp. CI.11.F.A3 TaxID=3079555 RepID=UPI0029432686|nr:hypothetical protein [Alteromonas sp. CI.11.F.A3]WOI37718.1 hypothetical protein R1T43_01380 [Alteromonas sp. CI.11.F.A3]
MRNLFILLLLVVSPYALAGKANTFKVDQVRVDRNGKGYVQFVNNLVETSPSCSTHPKHLAFDVNAPGGQAIFSLALAAKASNKKIWAVGTGTCDVYGVVESWSWGVIKD